MVRGRPSAGSSTSETTPRLSGSTWATFSDRNPGVAVTICSGEVSPGFPVCGPDLCRLPKEGFKRTFPVGAQGRDAQGALNVPPGRPGKIEQRVDRRDRHAL